MFLRSILWRTTAYYSALMFLMVLVLCLGVYSYEKQAIINGVDNTLGEQLMVLLPKTATHPDLGFQRGGGGPRRRPNGTAPRGRDTVSGAPESRRGLASGYSHGEAASTGEPMYGSGPETVDELASTYKIAVLLIAEGYPGFETERERRRFEKVLAAFDIATFDTYIVIWSGDGKELFRSSNTPAATTFPEQAEEVRGSNLYRWVGGNREVVHQPPWSTVLVGRTAESINATVAEFRFALFGGGSLVCLVFSMLGTLVLRRGLKPIKDISIAAEGISEGDLNRRIDTAKMGSELSPVAHVLNRTFGRLHNAIQQQTRYNADASHELRTPLAIIMASCDFSLKKERSHERYLKTIRVCRETADHMANLVEDLSLLAKADASTLKLEKEIGDLAVLLREIRFITEPLLIDKRLTFEFSLKTAICAFDWSSLKQIMINLIGNAVRYNRNFGTIFLRSGVEGDTAYAEIEDTGIGISEDALGHVFDRFYRVDSARNVDEGHSGLGLAIAKAIVEAHDGRISVRSSLGKGTCFRIELTKRELDEEPVADIEAAKSMEAAQTFPG